MTTMICLPGISSQPPTELTCSKSFSQPDVSLLIAKEQLADCAVPEVIAGSCNTPANWWIAAQLQFPEASRLVQQGDGQWLKIADQAVREFPVSDSAAKVEPKPTIDKKPAPAPSPTASTGGDGQTADLPWETFKLFIFNASDAENRFHQYLREAEDRQAVEPGLSLRVHAAARQGKHAAALADTLEKKLRQGENLEDVRAWKDRVCKSQPTRIVKHLNIRLEKSIDFHQSKRSLWQKNRNFRIDLPYTLIENGVHPQSLRARPASTRWEIYIDEAGSDFSERAQALKETDKNLGRIIALALPLNHGLPALTPGTHATDLTHEKIQALLRALTQSKIGLLGATLKNDLHSHSWIAATTKLIRWVVMMLPVDGPTQVTFNIENRGGYKDSASLRAVEENLIDELRQLAPDRFKALKLSLELVTKDAPYNGYVDVIANCWGSPDDIKRRLLTRTGWRGHCLLQSTDLADIDRLYQEAGSDPDNETWFALCTHLAKEPGHSLFHDLLAQLGVRARKDRSIWQRYLDAMRQKITLKSFDAGSLGRALKWLKQYQPDGERLPGLIELQLASAELASANHLGQSNVQQVAQVMKLAEELRDESAPDACEAALRIAISGTNSFDFTSVIPFIEQWISQPIAVPGRLNHGKLHSTLGQLCAFRADYDSAIKHFDGALEHFGQLSDEVQSNRNCQQTLSYKAIAQLDMQSAEASNAVRQLTNRATGKKASSSTSQLARSTSPLRFEHYLLLRWLVSQPEETQARQDYLAFRDDWQMGEGHPWMLINAYRAWLLVEDGRDKDATGYLEQAIEECDEAEDSAILHWMAHCLHALGESLGLTTEPPARPCPAAPFPAEQLTSLREAKGQANRMQALNRLLPFNFH